MSRGIGSIFALDSEFLSVVTLPVAVQPTDDIMSLSGWNSRQYNTIFFIEGK